MVLGSKSAVGLSGVEEHTLMQALPLGPFTPPCREQSVRREIALSLPMIVNAAFSLSHQKHFPLILVVVAHFAHSDPSTQGGRIPLHCISVVCAPALCSAPADGRGGYFLEEGRTFYFSILYSYRNDSKLQWESTPVAELQVSIQQKALMAQLNVSLLLRL